MPLVGVIVSHVYGSSGSAVQFRMPPPGLVMVTV